MSHPHPRRPLYLGMRGDDLAGKPYARFWNPRMAPLPAHAAGALLHGGVASALLPRLAEARSLLEGGEAELENGFGRHGDGSIVVAIRTEMPEVSPAMIDWWFGWHGSEAQRYKLWHPRAHVHVEWAGRDAPWTKGRERYVGRTSLVDEYIGSEMSHVAIRFVPPASLGFDERALTDPEQATVVCARIGFVDQPADVGYLVHHVRRVAGGSEMRSRFWLGGHHGSVRAGRWLSPGLSWLARRVVRPSATMPQDLLVHCSQEMSHLATFLPALYADLRDLP